MSRRVKRSHYVAPARYTPEELVRCSLLDLISDIRCAIRDDQPEYAEACRRQFRELWPKRHTERAA